MGKIRLYVFAIGIFFCFISGLPSISLSSEPLVLPVAEDFLKGSILHKGGGPTGSLLYEGLVTKNDRGGYDGWLARAWKSEEKARIWTFSLVRNAMWHDGVPFTARDVQFTYEYMKANNLWLAAVLWMVDRVVCPDDYTAVFHLKESFPKFLDELSHCPGIAIIPRHIWEHTANPMRHEDRLYIGTGPFRFVRKIPGQFFEMEDFDEYHGRKPSFSRVILRVMKNADIKNLALKSGDIHAMDNVLPWIAPLMDREKDIAIFRYPSQRLYTLSFNCRTGPTSSAPFRRALAHAVNREKICKRVFNGYARPATTWLMPHLASGYIDESVTPRAYDLDRARRLLQEAGYRLKNGSLCDRDGRTVRLIFVLGAKGTVCIVTKIAEVLRKDFSKLGISLELKQVDFSRWFKEVHKNHLFVSAMPDLMHDDADDLTHFRSRSFFGRPNWYGYSNPDFDELARQLQRATEFQERRRIAFAMQEVLARDIPSLAVCGADGLTAYRSDKIAFKGSMDTMYGNILDLKSLLSIKPVNMK